MRTTRITSLNYIISTRKFLSKFGYRLQYSVFKIENSERILNIVSSEIENRFGKLDPYSINFLELIKIRVLANALKLKHIAHYGQTITITYSNDTKERIQSPSKDWDDVLGSIMTFLRKRAEGNI